MTAPPPGRPARVAVIVKKSAYEIYSSEQNTERLHALLKAHDPSVARIEETHRSHVEAIARARTLLASMGAAAEFWSRDHARSVDGFDLVVTLGGDGILLFASHFAGPSTPVVGINTSPRSSVGYFCAGDKDAMGDILRDALAGALPALSLARMRVEIDGRALTDRVLNDVLFCHPCPAATSRYLLAVAGASEDQRSSGVWVGPAAGSTGAQRSAGGDVLPLESQELQYVVREPYEPSGAGYRLSKGRVPVGGGLRIRCTMPTASVYLDGPYWCEPMEIGSELRLARSAEPLTLLGLTAARARRGAP